MIAFPRLGAALLAALLAAAAPASAQLLPGLDAGGDGPIEIAADQALEWQREQFVFVARGNAVAKRGGSEVIADTLFAHYREGPNGETQIHRIVAEGKVQLRGPEQQRVFGDRAVYEVDSGKLVVTGKGNLRLETATDVVTARDALEYSAKDQVAVARGDAVMQRGTDKLRAELLTARFAKDPKTGSTALSRVDAKGDVVVTTPTDVARGETGVYDAAKQIATLSGGVKLTRGQNQLNGSVAEVNLATGQSRVLAGGPAQGGRVTGLFQPGSEKSGAPAKPAPAPAPAKAAPAPAKAAPAKPAAKPAQPAKGAAPAPGN
ncbi:MAG TPA: LptA/OstA family protein [Alphaproteobacteria bacterium]|nr:LptA/OstA family protein [Alphaproteobacteria bacterium]